MQKLMTGMVQTSTRARLNRKASMYVSPTVSEWWGSSGKEIEKGGGGGCVRGYKEGRERGVVGGHKSGCVIERVCYVLISHL